MDIDILIFEFLTLTFGHFGEVDATHLEPRERETELNLRDMGGMRCDIWEKGGSFAKIVTSSHWCDWTGTLPLANASASLICLVGVIRTK